tara:strand:- start:57 stop:245 length:189 start_codon:yes stop_codon:yes gene_type:complete
MYSGPVIINDMLLFSGEQGVKNAEHEVLKARDIKVGDVILFKGNQISVKSIKKRTSFNMIEK